MANCSGNCNLDSAGAFDFTVRRGDTLNFQLAFSTYAVGETIEDAIPRDITTSSFAMQVRLNGVLALDLSSDNGKLVITAPNLLNIQVPAGDMRITSGNYLYDLQETDSDGKVTTQLAGNFIVLKDITEISDFLS